jgi:hypothetical protein
MAQYGFYTTYTQAMSRVRLAHDKSIAQGIADHWFFVTEARYFVLEGDREQAIDLLKQSANKGLILGIELNTIWPGLTVLVGDPAYDSIQVRIFENFNAERAELGLEPIST